MIGCAGCIEKAVIAIDDEATVLAMSVRSRARARKQHAVEQRSTEGWLR